MFLKTTDRAWTYGETVAEVQQRVTEEPVVLTPGLDAESVFDVLAGVFGGGARVDSPLATLVDSPEMNGARLVVFTSGTTGVPKGVRLTFENLRAAAGASVEHLDHDEFDTWLLAMPLGHVGGLSILVRSAYAGGAVRLLPEFDPVSFSIALHGDVTMVSVVPTMLHQVLEHDSGPYEGLRAVLVGGGPIPHGLLERGADAGLPVLPTYGMTETFGQMATLKPDSSLEGRAHPLPGIQLRIEPDGRIAVRGPQVSPGYLGEPDRADDWFVTSDLGELDDDGAVKVTGRADDVIVTGGENVDPTRVEIELLALPGVTDVVVVGIPDEEWGEVVAAMYVGSETEIALTAVLGQRLPRHMVPTRWLSVDAMPKTALDKDDRYAVLTLLEAQDW